MPNEQKISNGVNKKIIIGIITLILLGMVMIIAKNNNQQPNLNVTNKTANKTQEQNAKKPADKLEVLLFYSTQRCISCITIGKFASETINEYFQSELRDGKIKFREINIDLPENKDLAHKFQASGSSLFINAITDGKDNINQDTNVWRLISNENQFKNYLKDKLNNLLGK